MCDPIAICKIRTDATEQMKTMGFIRIKSLQGQTTLERMLTPMLNRGLVSTLL